MAAPSEARNFTTSLGAMQAQGCPTFVEVRLFFWCLVFGLTFRTFRLIFFRLILKTTPNLANIKF